MKLRDDDHLRVRIEKIMKSSDGAFHQSSNAQAVVGEDELYGADMHGDELPAQLARRETRLAKLSEAKTELEAEAEQREQARREAMRAEGRRRASRPAVVTRLRPRRPRSATSPIPTRRCVARSSFRDKQTPFE